MSSTAGRIQYITAPGQPSFDEEVPQGHPEVENPFGEAEPTAQVITQRYMQRRAFYQRPAENSRCPATISRAFAFFVDDSARVPLGVADLVTWTRTWATKPAEFTEYDQIAVQMPARAAAYRFDVGAAGAPFEWYPYLAAKSYSLPRRANILRKFYLVGSGPDIDYVTPGGIPANNETIYTGADRTGLGTGPLTDDQYTSMTAQNIGYFSGAVLDPGGVTTGSGNVTYVAGALAAGTYNVGQSRLRRYLGNIWERTSTQIVL